MKARAARTALGLEHSALMLSLVAHAVGLVVLLQFAKGRVEREGVSLNPPISGELEASLEFGDRPPHRAKRRLHLRFRPRQALSMTMAVSGIIALKGSTKRPTTFSVAI